MKKLDVGEVPGPEVDEMAETLPEEILKEISETEKGAEIIRVRTQMIKVIGSTPEIVDINDGDAGAEGQKN